jgi:hypothetical protein
LLALVTAGLGWLLLSSKSEGNRSLHVGLQHAQSGVDFPLYYPAVMPESFYAGGRIDDDSRSVTFMLTYDNTKPVVVTQQPRPPLMEEVKKISTFTTPLGEAYIADLNGHKAGFLLTDKTLIIVSSLHDVETVDLKELLDSMGRL